MESMIVTQVKRLWPHCLDSLNSEFFMTQQLQARTPIHPCHIPSNQGLYFIFHVLRALRWAFIVFHKELYDLI